MNNKELTSSFIHGFNDIKLVNISSMTISCFSSTAKYEIHWKNPKLFFYYWYIDIHGKFFILPRVTTLIIKFKI